MSFWGATVITNLASAIPVIGQEIAYWLWGGFSVDNATLVRFFAIHYLVPFIMLGVVFLHLTMLHISGSTNPIGAANSTDYIPFYPYYFLKDLHGLFIFLFIFSIIIFFYPNALGHPDNYIRANPLVTPAHIVPEWYFLPFYAILRAIPSKLGGVVAMGGSILIVALLPIFDRYPSVTNPEYRGPFIKIFFFWAVCFVLLGQYGAKPVAYPYTEVSRFLSIFYFSFIILYIPLNDKFFSTFCGKFR